MADRKCCPVCGAEQTKEEVYNEYGCIVCGYSAAFADRFISKKSYQDWKKITGERSAVLLARLQGLCAGKNVFTLSADGLIYTSPKDKKVYMLSGYDEDAQISDVVQIAASERTQVLLMKDGSVKANGTNANGECDVKEWRGISFVEAGPDCTYGISKSDGSVLWAGISCSADLSSWRGIRKIKSGNYHVAGLTGAGKVLIAGRMLEDGIVNEVKRWKDIVDIDTSGECTIALTKKGTVEFAGDPADPRNACRNWKNVIAIAMESIYVLGITKEGTLLQAGQCRSKYLDMGRSEAKNWGNVIAVCCSRSGIAAVEKNGTLHIAGSVFRKEQLVKQYQTYLKKRVIEELVKG